MPDAYYKRAAVEHSCEQELAAYFCIATGVPELCTLGNILIHAPAQARANAQLLLQDLRRIGSVC